MSYAVPAPTAPAPRRPTPVSLAAALLAIMAVAGLGYAIATLIVVPGVVSRLRADAGAIAAEDVDGVVGLIWIGAGAAVALALLLFGLYLALALGLRRGSNVARVCTWVVSGLGLLAGCGSALAVLAQRSSSDDFGGVGGPLNDAYPAGWVGLNVALAVGQMLGYLAVAGLLVAAPGHFFAKAASAAPPAAPGPYGAYGALPGMPGLYDRPAAPAPGPYGAPYGGTPAGPYGGHPASPGPAGPQPGPPPHASHPPSQPGQPSSQPPAQWPVPPAGGDEQQWTRPPA